MADVVGYEYVQMSEGDELCGEDVTQIIESLNAIADHIGTTSDLVTCQEVNLSLTHIDNEGVVESPLKDPDGLITGEVDLKLIAVTWDVELFSDLDDVYDFSPVSNITVSCGENIIHSAGYGQCDTRRILLFSAYCSRDEDLTFTFDVTSGVDRTQADVKICGAILCIGQQTRNLDSFFKYTGSDPACNDFRTALNMAAQNTRALHNEVANSCEQTARCVEVASSDTDNLIVATNINRGAAYFVIGSITVSARMRWLTNNINGTIEVSPFIGCEGEQSQCGKFVGSIPYREEGEPEGPLVTFNIPVVRCGYCNSGDTLYAGMTQEVLCEGLPQLGLGAVNSAVIESVEQQYCAWVFEKVETDTLPVPFTRRLDRCLTSAFTQELANTIEGIHAFVCLLNPVNLTIRSPNIPSTFDLSAGTLTDTIVIQQPIAVDPDEPIPVKKWTVNLTMLPEFTGTPTDDGVTSLFTVRLRCGATVLAERFTNWVSANGEGLLNRGNTQGSCLYISGCFDCPVDQPLILEIDIVGEESYTAAPAAITAFCF